MKTNSSKTQRLSPPPPFAFDPSRSQNALSYLVSRFPERQKKSTTKRGTPSVENPSPRARTSGSVFFATSPLP